jgi:hypothetical protein
MAKAPQQLVILQLEIMQLEMETAEAEELHVREVIGAAVMVLQDMQLLSTKS